MLSITSKSLYGVYALFELAISHERGALTIREISKSQKIPEDYLRQLLVVLKRAGLVQSTRGINGGYALTKKPAEITIRDIIETLEGKINLVDAEAGEPLFDDYWKECSAKLKEALNTTLEELVEKKCRLDENITYYI